MLDEQIKQKIITTKFSVEPSLTINKKWIHSLANQNGELAVKLLLPFPCASWHQSIIADLSNSLQQLAGIKSATVSLATKIDAHVVQGGVRLIPKVKNIIAIASGKGGVGKSTCAVNLALALQQEGARVGVLDADIYGPSIPKMLGVSLAPASLDNKTMQPVENFALQINSIGLLVGESQAMIWRAPMAVQALTQLLNQTNWQDLDYLIIDLPPGTGDIQLTMAQKIPVTGAVIVTTPQDIALLDARKGISMFNKVNVPILGIVENMSVYQCPKCGHSEHIFAADGGKKLAAELEIELLASLPLESKIRQQTDAGKPTVVAEPHAKVSELYRTIARKVTQQIAQKQIDYSSKYPQINIRQL